MKAREVGRKGVVVGDRVALVGDVSGRPDTLARVVRVEPRTTMLRRSADDDDPIERVLVANADQLVIVTALADPEPRPRMIDRCLVAAYDAGLEPVLVLTKSDLASADDLLALYGALDVQYLVTRQEGTDPVDVELAARPARAATCRCSSATAASGSPPWSTPSCPTPSGRSGSSTSSPAAAATPRPPPSPCRCPSGGWVIDTPGVRSFGLAHVDPQRVFHAFPDLEAGTDDCPRSCSHDEPECALDAWVADGHAGTGGAMRLESLRRLLRSRAGGDDAAPGEDVAADPGA